MVTSEEPVSSLPQTMMVVSLRMEVVGDESIVWMILPLPA